MNTHPIFASLLLASQASRWYQSLDGTTRERYAIWGAVILVIAGVLVAIYLYHSRQADRELRHHSRRYQHASRTSQERGRRHRRRRRSHEDLPRNPTLAETGGLPPLRGPSASDQSPS